MPNLRELENAMPVAPLKIAALPSARKMGQRINNYLVEFRKTIHNDILLKKEENKKIPWASQKINSLHNHTKIYNRSLSK